MGVRQSESLRKLIREQIPDRHFGIFSLTGEGRMMPNGREERSGCVIDDTGKHYQFWETWSPDLGKSILEWEMYEPLAVEIDGWLQWSEYRLACQEAGVPYDARTQSS